MAAAGLLSALVLTGRLLGDSGTLAPAASGGAGTPATVTGRPVAPPAGLCDEAGACQDGLVWLPLDGFVVPPGFTGAPGSLGALAILATPDPGAAGGMGFWCPNQRPIATPALGGRPAVLATCPAGFQGWSADSVLLRWSRRGTFVTVGLRGPSEGNQRLLVALAGSLPLVPPRR